MKLIKIFKKRIQSDLDIAKEEYKKDEIENTIKENDERLSNCSCANCKFRERLYNYCNVKQKYIRCVLPQDCKYQKDEENK